MLSTISSRELDFLRELIARDSGFTFDLQALDFLLKQDPKFIALVGSAGVHSSAVQEHFYTLLGERFLGFPWPTGTISMSDFAKFQTVVVRNHELLLMPLIRFMEEPGIKVGTLDELEVELRATGQLEGPMPCHGEGSMYLCSWFEGHEGLHQAHDLNGRLIEEWS